MMKQMMKINAVSILYALFILIPIELMVNVYRISRLSGWDIATVTNLSDISFLLQMLLGTILFYMLTVKWLDRSRLNYLTVILWVPYFYLFITIIASLSPITYGADDPNPASGLIVIGGLIAFPIYVLIINLAGSIRRNNSGERWTRA